MLEEENRFFNRKVKNTFLFVLLIAIFIYPVSTVEAAEEPLFYVPKVVSTEMVTYQVPKVEVPKELLLSAPKVTNTEELNYSIPKVEATTEPLFSIPKVVNTKELIYPNLKIEGIEDFKIDSQQYCESTLPITQMEVKQTVEKVQNNLSLQLQSAIVDTKQQIEQSRKESFEQVQIIQNCIKENEKELGEYFLTSQPAMEYTEEDIKLLATVIYAEAGICDEMEKYRVGNVVLNRVNDATNEFQNSIEGVIYQDGQFTSVGGTNWQHGPTEEEISIATELLEGKRVFPEYIVWFSKKCNYGKVYYTSEWHEFSGWELDESISDKIL